MTCAGPGVAEVSADVCNEENYGRKRETWRIIREVYAHTTSYIKELSILLNIIKFFCSFSLKKKKSHYRYRELFKSKQKKSQTPLETCIEGREITTLKSLIKMEFLNLANWRMVENAMCHMFWAIKYF